MCWLAHILVQLDISWTSLRHIILAKHERILHRFKPMPRAVTTVGRVVSTIFWCSQPGAPFLKCEHHPHISETDKICFMGLSEILWTRLCEYFFSPSDCYRVVASGNRPQRPYLSLIFIISSCAAQISKDYIPLKSPRCTKNYQCRQTSRLNTPLSDPCKCLAIVICTKLAMPAYHKHCGTSYPLTDLLASLPTSVNELCTVFFSLEPSWRTPSFLIFTWTSTMSLNELDAVNLLRSWDSWGTGVV